MEENKKPAIGSIIPEHERNTIPSNTNRKFYVLIGIALLVIAIVWIWKTVETGNIKRKAERDRQALKKEATRQIVQSHEVHLKLLAKAYIWAVRAEMMQGNLNQVNLFANDMVKEKNFQRIVIVNDKGVIVSSTNKKDEGQPFSTVGKDAALSSNSTGVENIGDSVLIMTSPIMGFNNRLGTLLIKYAIEQPDFNHPETASKDTL